jgi:hypothetical protein
MYFVTNFFNLDCVASGLNDGITGIVPPEFKELTELKDLHLSGTALTGSISLEFCIGDFNITNFEAYCAGVDASDVQCTCCTECCEGIDDPPDTCGSNPFTKALSVLLLESDLDRTALSTPGTLQYQALNWPVYEDPAANTNSATLLERYTAALFYFATQGNKWINQTAWLSENAVCSWSGLECNERGFLARMDLGTCLLASFCLCSKTVRSLTKYSVCVIVWILGLNSVVGQIPSELAVLTHLEYLQLSKSFVSFYSFHLCYE